jgi:hypothetical protein
MDNNTHNKQIEDNAHQLDSEFDVIISFVKKINTSLSLDKMVEYTLDEVIAAFQPDLAMIFLREGETLAHAGELSKAFTYDVSPLNRMRKC